MSHVLDVQSLDVGITLLVFDAISVATGGGANGGNCPPPTVLGLDPEIRTDPLRSVKVVGGSRGGDRLYIHTKTYASVA